MKRPTAIRMGRGVAIDAEAIKRAIEDELRRRREIERKSATWLETGGHPGRRRPGYQNPGDKQ